MSHITKVSTQLKDGEALRRTLMKLGYRIVEGGRLQGDQNSGVEFTANKGRLVIGLSRKKCEQGYEICADWHGFGKQKIVNEIFQNYSREKVIKMARLKGYSVVQNRMNENGQIEMVLRKIA